MTLVGAGEGEECLPCKPGNLGSVPRNSPGKSRCSGFPTSVTPVFVGETGKKKRELSRILQTR